MKRGVLIAAATVLVLFLGADIAGAEFLGSDAFGELTGMTGQTHGGLMDRYSISAYSLDYYIDNTGFGGLPNPTSWPAELTMWLASFTWSITSLVMWLTIQLVAWALSFDFLTGPHGALRPIGEATQNLYHSVFGTSTLQAVFALAGIWGLAMLVQKKHAKLVNGYVMSAIFVVIGLMFVFQPVRTATEALSYTNPLKLAVLAGTQGGTADQATTRARDRLFEAYVFKPWVIVEFGGLKHCVDTDDVDENGYPHPVSSWSKKRDVCRPHITTGKDGHGGYAARFLKQPFGSKMRKAEYDAIREGKVPAGDPQFSGYSLDKADSPAVDYMQQGGATQRALLSFAAQISMWGAILLFGWIAIAALMVSVVLLAFLATSAIALLCAAFPGVGHRIFTWWLTKVALLWFAPIALALAVSVILTISIAFASATAFMGALPAMFVNSLLCWGMFLSRKRLIHSLAGRVASHAPDRTVERTTEVVHKTASWIATPVAAGAGAAWGHFKSDQEHEKKTESTEHTESTESTETSESTVTAHDSTAATAPSAQPSASPPAQPPVVADRPRVEYAPYDYDTHDTQEPMESDATPIDHALNQPSVPADVYVTENGRGEQELSDPVHSIDHPETPVTPIDRHLDAAVPSSEPEPDRSPSVDDPWRYERP